MSKLAISILEEQMRVYRVAVQKNEEAVVSDPKRADHHQHWADKYRAEVEGLEAAVAAVKGQREQLAQAWEQGHYHGHRCSGQEMHEAHPEPNPYRQARTIADNPLERGTGGHYWCPACDGQLVDPGPSDTVWYHIFGERNGCGWTE